LDVLSIQSDDCRIGEKTLRIRRQGERRGKGKGEEGGGRGGEINRGGTIVELLKSVFIESIADDPGPDSDGGAVTAAAIASALGSSNEEARTSSSRASSKTHDRSGNQDLDQNPNQNNDCGRNRRAILLSSFSRIACRISRVTQRVEDNHDEALDSSRDPHQKRQKRTYSGHSSQISNSNTNNELFSHLREDDCTELNDADSNIECVISILLDLLCLVPMECLTPGRNQVQDPVTGCVDLNNLPTGISEIASNKSTEKYGIFGGAGDNEREWSSIEEGVSSVSLSDACDLEDYPTQHQISKWVGCGDVDGLWISIVSTPILPGFKKKGAQILGVDSLKESVSPRSIGITERYYVGCGSDEYFPLIQETFFSLRIDIQMRSLFAISCRLKREVQRILRDRSLLSECSLKALWDAVACCQRVSSIARRVLENALSDADVPLSAYDSLFLSVSRLAGGSCILNILELGSSSAIFRDIYFMYDLRCFPTRIICLRFFLFLCASHGLAHVDCVSNNLI
jgi:hypothetical protein